MVKKLCDYVTIVVKKLCDYVTIVVKKLCDYCGKKTMWQKKRPLKFLH